MTKPEEGVWLTYRGAAARTKRSVRTIKRWVRDGLPAGWDLEGRRIILEEELLAEKRRRLEAWPPHQYRMKKLRGDSPGEFYR